MRATLAVLLAVVSAAGVPHTAPDMPSGWAQTDHRLPNDYKVEFDLSLKQTNLGKIIDIAKRVSDPDSDIYGQHLTSMQLASLTAPTAKDRSRVEKWLSEANVSFKRVGHNVIQVSTTVGVAASLLKTSFHHLSNKESGQRVVHARDYELPAEIESGVAAVYGMHGLPLPPTAHSTVQVAPLPPAQVTPSVIAKTYDVTGVTASGSEKNRQAVAEFEGETMKTQDLRSFFQKFVSGAPTSASTVHKFVPGSGTGTAGIEASLDIEYIMGVAPGVLTEFWYFKGDDFCKDLQSWTSTMLSSDDTPLVHSVSYGVQGNLSYIGCTTAEVSDIDTNFVKLAAKGITIIFASGDSGSGYELSDSLLHPSWPASSPWVTAVGSTRFQNQAAGNPEQATDSFGSGGGFSTMFDAFDGQKAAVANYFKVAAKLPTAGSYPPGGRATPDVAALGEGFQVMADGQKSVGGTSASAPAFAGLVSLLNEARLKAGRPAMGYLNPWLYKNPGAFTDITVGNNSLSRGGSWYGRNDGFLCAEGWDPVTGLGTPVFSKMLSAAMSSKTSEAIVV